METKHTPGPWTVNKDVIEAIVENNEGYVAPICHLDMEWSDGQSEANASLIASAPDLLRERDTLKEELTELKNLIKADSLNATTQYDFFKRERDELKEALTDKEYSRLMTQRETERLSSLNAELLKALKAVTDNQTTANFSKAFAVIKKAEGRAE